MLDKAALCVRRFVLAVGVLALAACGGGGGDDVAPPSSGLKPLALTPQTMNDAALTAVGAGESMLGFGQMAADFAGRFAASAAALRESCPNGGTLALELLDRDGNGRASAGDRVTAQMRDCGIPKLAQVLTGVVTVELSAAATGQDAGVRGTIDFGDGLDIVAAPGRTGGLAGRLLGTLAFDAAATARESTMAAASTAADDLHLVTEGEGGSATDAFRAVAVRKQVAYDRARSITGLALRVESETLRGSFTVTTPEPLLAWLDTYPEVGRIELRGAGATVLTLTPNFVTESRQLDLALDVGGDGSVERNASLDWQAATTGYLWWGGRFPVAWSPQPFVTQTFASNAFSYGIEVPALPTSADPVRIQFTRVPQDFGPPLARFVDFGGPAPDALRLDVAATVTHTGALVLVQPDQALRHGRFYQLQFSTDGGVTWGFTGPTLSDELGNTVSLTGSPAFFGTPDTMRAVAGSDTRALVGTAGVARLDGSTSTSARPIASYRWTQLSGTPLVFDTPDAASSTVHASAEPPTLSEPAVVQLTITDTAGEVEFTRLTLTLVRATTIGRVLYLRSTAGEPIGQGDFTLASGADGSFTVSSFTAGAVFVNYQSNDFTLNASVSLAANLGSPFVVGPVENAGAPAAQPGTNWLQVTRNFRSCGGVSIGRFDVLEVTLDAQGQIATLAVDFEQRCDSEASPPLFGSLRVNSSVPLRP